jgi:aspartate ammonia-lyase
MPGKVNPVLLEAAIQTGIKVMGNDVVIADAASRGTWQISEFMPLLAHAFLESLDLLVNINRLLAEHIEKIEADAAKCMAYFERSPMTITALLPFIGYEKAAALFREFRQKDGIPVRKFLEEKLGGDLVDDVLSPYQLTALGFKDG